MTYLPGGLEVVLELPIDDVGVTVLVTLVGAMADEVVCILAELVITILELVGLNTVILGSTLVDKVMLLPRNIK